MNIVSIDYLGIPDHEWFPYYKWTFLENGEKHSIICRHAEKYLKRVLQIALSDTKALQRDYEEEKHQVNSYIAIEEDIDHAGFDIMLEEDTLRIIGWENDVPQFDFCCDKRTFVKDIARMIDQHFQKIGILNYETDYSAFSVNRDNDYFKSFERQDFWITRVVGINDIVLFKAYALGYDTSEMIQSCNAELLRDTQILLTPIP